MDKINIKIIIVWAIILILTILSVTYIIVHLSKNVMLSTLNYNTSIQDYVENNQAELEKIQAQYDEQLREIEMMVGTSENLDAIYITNYMSNYQLEKTLKLESKYLLMVAIIAIILVIEVLVEMLLKKSRSLLLKIFVIYIVMLSAFFVIINIPGYLFYNISLIELIEQDAGMYIIIMALIIFVITTISVIINQKDEAKRLNKALNNVDKSNKI